MRTATVTFTTPLANCPTLNHREHHMARARKTAALRHEAAWQARAQCPRVTFDRCTLDVTYGWPDHRHRDADNWSVTKKAAVDGFVDAGLLTADDDTHIVRQSLAAHVVDGAKPGHVELTFVLTEVES